MNKEQEKKIKDLISFNQDDKYINNLKTFEAVVNSQDYNNFIIKFFKSLDLYR